MFSPVALLLIAALRRGTLALLEVLLRWSLHLASRPEPIMQRAHAETKHKKSQASSLAGLAAGSSAAAGTAVVAVAAGIVVAAGSFAVEEAVPAIVAEKMRPTSESPGKKCLGFDQRSLAFRTTPEVLADVAPSRRHSTTATCRDQAFQRSAQQLTVEKL